MTQCGFYFFKDHLVDNCAEIILREKRDNYRVSFSTGQAFVAQLDHASMLSLPNKTFHSEFYSFSKTRK